MRTGEEALRAGVATDKELDTKLRSLDCLVDSSEIRPSEILRIRWLCPCMCLIVLLLLAQKRQPRGKRRRERNFFIFIRPIGDLGSDQTFF